MNYFEYDGLLINLDKVLYFTCERNKAVKTADDYEVRAFFTTKDYVVVKDGFFFQCDGKDFIKKIKEGEL